MAGDCDCVDCALFLHAVGICVFIQKSIVAKKSIGQFDDSYLHLLLKSAETIAFLSEKICAAACGFHMRYKNIFYMLIQPVLTKQRSPLSDGGVIERQRLAVLPKREDMQLIRHAAFLQCSGIEHRVDCRNGCVLRRVPEKCGRSVSRHVELRRVKRISASLGASPSRSLRLHS